MEEWKDIPGFDGYQVSNLGRVRSFWILHHDGRGSFPVIGNSPRLLRQSIDKKGYAHVYLYKQPEGIRCGRMVHRLVAEAFVPGYFDSASVDHINPCHGEIKDNSAENLQWVSLRKNVQKSFYDGTRKTNLIPLMQPIVVHDTWTNENIYFESIAEASRVLNISYKTISKALLSERLINERYYPEYLEGEDRLLYDPSF